MYYLCENCRKDSFITHRAFCDALAEESARLSANQLVASTTNPLVQSLFLFPTQQHNNNNTTNFINPWDPNPNPNPSNLPTLHNTIKPESHNFHTPIFNNTNNISSPSLLLHHPPKTVITSPYGDLHRPSNAATSAHLSATALLQKAATFGAAAITGPTHVTPLSMPELGTGSTQLDSVPPERYMNMRGLTNSDGLTRDFLGLTNGDAVNVSIDVKDMLTFTGGSVEYNHYHHQPYDHHHNHSNSLFKPQHGFGFLGTTTGPESWGNCEWTALVWENCKLRSQIFEKTLLQSLILPELFFWCYKKC